jgi:AraC-like DNA-binding protein
MKIELQVILLILFVLNTFLGVLHFGKQPRNQSNTFLGIFIILFGFSVLHILLVNVLFQTKYNPLILLPLNLIFFPFYFLIRYFDKFLSFQVYSKLFENSILFIALVEIITNLLPTGAWIYTSQFNNELIAFVFTIKRIFIFILLPFGFYTLYHLLKKSIIYKPRTNDDKLRLKWINEMIILIIILIIVIILPELARLLKMKNLTIFLVQAIIGSLVILYIGLRNLNVQVSSAIETAKETNRFNPETNLNFKNIQRLFVNERIYLNSELRITDVANKISLTPNYVSKIVNENANMNFNDFVNQYRVNEIVEKFKNNEHQKKSIFALAQESGFKSKSTFQTVFKKITEKTPTQYIKEFDIQ